MTKRFVNAGKNKTKKSGLGIAKGMRSFTRDDAMRSCIADD